MKALAPRTALTSLRTEMGKTPEAKGTTIPIKAE